MVRIAIGAPGPLVPALADDPHTLQVLSGVFAPLVTVDDQGDWQPLAAAAVEPDPARETWTITLRPDFSFHNGEPVRARHYLDAWSYAAAVASPHRHLFAWIAGFETLQHTAAETASDNSTGPEDPTQSAEADQTAGAEQTGAEQTTGAARAAWEWLAGLEEVDERTFRVRLAAPFGEFPLLLSNLAFAPLPEAAFAADGHIREEFWLAPVGNGPYRVVASTAGERYELRRYDGYPAVTHHNGAGAASDSTGNDSTGNDGTADNGAADNGAAGAGDAEDSGNPENSGNTEDSGNPEDTGNTGEPNQASGLDLLVYEDPLRAYADLLNRQVDVLAPIPAAHLPSAATDLAGRLVTVPGSNLQYFAFPAHVSNLRNPDVRRAISMALDRDHLANLPWPGGHLPARSLAAPAVVGAAADTCAEACTLDVDAARELYSSAGGPDRLTITYNADGGHQDWVEAACAQLRANLAVECEAVAEPTLGDLLTGIENRQIQGMVRLSWSMEYPSMGSYLGPVFATGGAANFAGYHNPDFDRLLAATSAEDPRPAVAGYRRAEEMLLRDLPALPVRFGQHTAGHTAAVSGVTVTRIGTVDFTRLSTEQLSPHQAGLSSRPLDP